MNHLTRPNTKAKTSTTTTTTVSTITPFHSSNLIGTPAPVSSWRKIPVVSWVRAGECTDYQDLCAQIEEWIQTDERDADLFSLIIQGDSMEPAFQEGDRVIISPHAIPQSGSYIAASIIDEGTTLKRYQRSLDGQRIRLIPLNPNYQTHEYHPSQFNWIYPVISLSRRLI